ncbi:MAG: 16S rRNA (cytosine(967)-C(5))-methyltransferase RsmB [Eubacteriales bacterium]|nr:16S rRNA (cytosine(967)-C(5))-methyltransferase RsmB [Eubacteriales bacterium]
MTKPTKEREIILDILLEVLERGGFVHVILRQALEKNQFLEKQDRAFITRVVEGTIEYRLTIDAVINSCSKVKVNKMKPVIRTILRMSVYQLLWMERIPDSAVCNEAVNLAVKRKFQGLKGFVNGVLRTIARQKDTFVFEDLSLKYSMPQWLIDLWREQYPEETVEEILKSFLAAAPTTVRCNVNQASMEEIRASLDEQQVGYRVSPLSSQALLLEKYDYLDSLEAFQKGWIQVQDASSGFVGDVADPKEGDQVLDVCGAPGGKSLHIADKLKGTGLVVVRDLTESKIRLVEDNLDRTGFTNVRAEVWDALEYDPDWEKKADIVIADLPCSGLGIIGKKPDIKYQVTPEKLDDLVSLQREILSVVSRYVKPGGKLIYSTCTIDRKENEDQRNWFLQEFPFESRSIEGFLGDAVQEEAMKDGYVQLLPGRYPCDGFFIASFVRRAE